MYSLFIITSWSPIVATMLTSYFYDNPHKFIVVTLTSEMADKCREVGVASLVLPINHGNMTDKEFRDRVMPGMLSGTKLPNGMPLWKTLSIDRLRFLRAPHIDQAIKVLNTINASEVLITSDLHNGVGWAFALQTSLDVTVLQTSPILTREWEVALSLHPGLSLSWIVASNYEAAFLVEFGVQPDSIMAMESRPEPEIQGNPLQSNILLLFDKQYIHEFNMIISRPDVQQAIQSGRAKVICADGRSRQLFTNVTKLPATFLTNSPDFAQTVLQAQYDDALSQGIFRNKVIGVFGDKHPIPKNSTRIKSLVLS